MHIFDSLPGRENTGIDIPISRRYNCRDIADCGRSEMEPFQDLERKDHLIIQKRVLPT